MILSFMSEWVDYKIESPPGMAGKFGAPSWCQGSCQYRKEGNIPRIGLLVHKDWEDAPFLSPLKMPGGVYASCSTSHNYN